MPMPHASDTCNPQAAEARVLKLLVTHLQALACSTDPELRSAALRLEVELTCRLTTQTLKSAETDQEAWP